MIDMEKVVRGLIACTSDDSQADDEWHDCENCPYAEDCATGNTGIGIPVMTDALAMLNEQKAVEPYITGNGESFEAAETWWYECGNCNKPIDPNDKYCRNCGKPILWEGR